MFYAFKYCVYMYFQCVYTRVTSTNKVRNGRMVVSTTVNVWMPLPDTIDVLKCELMSLFIPRYSFCWRKNVIFALCQISEHRCSINEPSHEKT